MVSFTIHNVGPFMSKLLSSDCFDSFLLEEAVIRMAVTYTIDGHLNKDFYESDADGDSRDPVQRPFLMQPWSEARGICREIIKGKRAPSSFRFTLCLKSEFVTATLKEAPDLQPGTLEAVSALEINIRLDSGGLHLVTGVSMNTFVADKSPDRVWDHTVERFLAGKGIDFARE